MNRRLVSLLILASAHASAAEIEVPVPHGRVFSDVYFPTGAPGTQDFNQVSTIGWLTLDPRLGETAAGVLTLEAAGYEASINPDYAGTVKLNLREGYFRYTPPGFDFRFGKQIVPWGKADGINPTDFLTAKDYTRFNPDDETRRIGATMLSLAVTPDGGTSPWTLTGVFTPVFPKSILLVPTDAIPADVAVGAPTNPATNLLGSEEALRLAYTASGWDFALVGFRGWDHLPQLGEGSLNLAGGGGPALTLSQTFHRISAVGGDLSFVTGSYITRAETSYTWTENDDATDPRIEPSHWDLVVGEERPIGDDFRVQAQFVSRYFPRFEAPATIVDASLLQTQVDREIATANATLHGYRRQWRPGGTLRLHYGRDSNPFSAEILAVGYAGSREYFVRPSLAYAWTDNLHTELGVEQYGGDVDQQLGALQQFNSVYLEGRYTF